jgi:sterol 14-demethylase
MVGCNEIANDPELLKKTLHHFETIESSATATTIIFPWLPSPALIKRTIAGAKLYMIFQRIVNNRKKTARTEDDPLQHLIDSGDDMQSIIAVCHLSIIP